jgi:hypothetical protein
MTNLYFLPVNGSGSSESPIGGNGTTVKGGEDGDSGSHEGAYTEQVGVG